MASKGMEKAIETLIATKKKIVDLDDEYKKKHTKAAAPFTAKLHEVYQKRQVEIDKIEDFWSDKISGADSPFVLDKTIDPRVLRAVSKFSIEFPEGTESDVRVVKISVRANIYTDAGDLSRKVNIETMDTLSITGTLPWKPGTEKSRAASVMNFFTQKGLEKQEDAIVMAAFEQLYRDPFSFEEATQ